jgi:hypothetical protein
MWNNTLVSLAIFLVVGTALGSLVGEVWGRSREGFRRGPIVAGAALGALAWLLWRYLSR